jgi:hypothetical protein
VVTENDDLRALSGEAEWYFTTFIPAVSDRADASHRFGLEWRNVRRALGDAWDDDELAAVDDQVAGLSPTAGPRSPSSTPWAVRP